MGYDPLTRASIRLSSPFPRSKGRLRRLGMAGMALLTLPLVSPPAQAQGNTGGRPEQARASRATLASLQDAFAAVADECEPAVVTLYTSKSLKKGGEENEGTPGILPFSRRGQRRTSGTGSGVIISKDGWVLTNDHVVGGADRVTVKLRDGREFSGTVRRDVRSDLALVKIEAPTSLPTARLGNSDSVKIGHWAIAIGSPYRYEGSFSVGVISSLYRSQRILDFSSSRGGRFYPNMIQTDAAINPGNSGGPLCNLDGEVIGINTAIESEGGGSVGIGFAIPINSAKFVIQQLLDKGKVSYGFLGVSPTSVTPRLASALKVAAGALIDQEPEADSPAGKAGLHAGDVVIAINDKPVRNELELRTIVAQTAPGTALELTVMRNGSEKRVKVTLAEARDDSPEPAKPQPAVKAKLGIEVQSLTDKLAEQAGVPTKTPGVVIKSLGEGTAASENNELEEGMVILKVNGKDTATVQAFQEATSGLKPGDAVRIHYQIGKTIRFTVITMD